MDTGSVQCGDKAISIDTLYVFICDLCLGTRTAPVFEQGHVLPRDVDIKIEWWTCANCVDPEGLLGMAPLFE